MKTLTLTKEEKEIENALLSGEFKPIKGKELENIEKTLKSRKKDITMTIRVNSEDIDKIKGKAKKLGIKYQSYISEIIHQVAQYSPDAQGPLMIAPSPDQLYVNLPTDIEH